MTSTVPPTPGESSPSTRPRHSLWASVLADVVAPVAIYYVLRALGVEQVWALLGGAAAPAARGLQVALRHRRLDALAGLTLSVIVLTVVTSLVSGDARFALARDAVVTLAVGIWILATLRLPRPFIYTFVTAFQPERDNREWDRTWQASAVFRRGMAVHTVIWGVGMLLDAVVRVVMAYTLPVDSVPLLNAIQYGALFAVLMTVSVVYSRVAGPVPGSPDYPAKAAATGTSDAPVTDGGAR